VGPIVCATRGGEASRRTQEKACALAAEREERLIFLYVVDPSFAEGVAGEMTEALTAELRILGRSLLRLAQHRARERDLRPEVIIREGPIRETIEAFLQEVQASTLIIGAPRSEEEPATFEPDQLSAFAKEIEQATGATVIVVE
jgi:nucleotide-binding universal stress UspA family protein